MTTQKESLWTLEEFFCLGNEKSNTFCQDLSQGFDGIADNTLTGKSNREKYACSRLVAIQLE